MTTDPLYVVLGATGGTGSALVAELAARSRRVRAVSRRAAADLPAGVEQHLGDVNDPAQARRAVAGASVVFHAAQPHYTRWPQEFPSLTRSILAATTAAEAKLVFADNLYMYGPTDGALTETTPMRATGAKGQVRSHMATELLDAHRQGRVRVTLGRASDYFGPGGVGSLLGEPLFAAALAGRTVRWPGRLDQPHTVSYLPDMARALITLGEHERADGEVFHLPAAEPLTGRQFLDLVAAELGRPVKASATGRLALTVAGLVSPMLREFKETLYQGEHPFVVDASKFEATFGPSDPSPHPRAIAATGAWFKQRLGTAASTPAAAAALTPGPANAR